MTGIVASAAMLTVKQPPAFRVQTESMRILVAVTNADGTFLRGLTKKDFRCRADGNAVEIRSLDVVRARPR